MEEVDKAQLFLETEPTSTIEYVAYLEFIDSAQIKADDLEVVLDYCKDLYDITEEFKIPVPVNDMNNYLGLSVTMGVLRNLIDRKIEERDKIIVRFNAKMNKDISLLIEEIGKIKTDCSVIFQTIISHVCVNVK